MLKLRKATHKDGEFLFALKNDPTVLAGSYIIRKPVKREDYFKWLNVRLADPQTELYIIEGEERIGDVRLDVSKEIEVSVRITEEHRRQGVSDWAIQEVCGIAGRYKRPIIAYIVDGNIASMRLFLKHKFVPVSYMAGPPIGLYKYVRQ